MLAQLTISNFAIVRELEIDFHSGMTAITGETGAGKSIAIDALGLCLGGRAEADMVRRGATRADLCARFALKDTPAAPARAQRRAKNSAQVSFVRPCLTMHSPAFPSERKAARAAACLERLSPSTLRV